MKMKDDTLALLKNPYRFIANKCTDLGKDVFETRIFLQKAYCMTGKEAAELFYNPDFFIRKGASPEALRATLFGKGGVQELDGAKHVHRKLMFMSLMGEENAGELSHIFSDKLRHYLNHWSLSSSIVLYEELQKVLTDTVCAWAGIRLDNEEKLRRTKEIVSLFDSAGAKGAGHFWARISRKNAEDWIQNIVIDLRSDGYEPLIKSPVEVIIWHRDLEEELLSPRIAAVEILNLIRPIVATSVYMIFMAHALHSNPDCYEKIMNGDEDYALKFIHEVRRYYPFFPSIVARVKEDFVWRDVHFKKGARAFLDLYGTDNDPRFWDSPNSFWPERFDFYRPDNFDFIPQGGGNPYHGHRCPGELFTVQLMKTALNFMLSEMEYEVPAQNLDIEWTRLPALPHSKFVINNVRPKALIYSTRVSQLEVTEIF